MRVVAVFCLILIVSCNSKKNPYINNLGVEPSLVAQIDTAHYTVIQWEDSLINFGSLKLIDSIHFKYRFKNIGSTPLFIYEAKPSCWCVDAKFSKEPIMPGKSGFILATLKSSAYKGDIYKTISVTTNTKNKSNHILILQGKILN